jgi:hypothetical protein
MQVDMEVVVLAPGPDQPSLAAREEVEAPCSSKERMWSRQEEVVEAVRIATKHGCS